MEKKGGSASIAEGLLVLGAGLLLLWICIGASTYSDATEKYDWHHGYGAHTKVSSTHCEEWVKKHWKGSDRNYKYQLSCFLRDPDFYDHNKYSANTVKAWYRYCYRHGRNTKGWDIGYYVKMRRAGKI